MRASLRIKAQEVRALCATNHTNRLHALISIKIPVSRKGIVGLRGAGPPSVRRKIKFVVALVMVTGGGLWLLFQLFIADYVFGRLIRAACLIVGIGAYWLWAHYINATPSQEDDWYPKAPVVRNAPPMFIRAVTADSEDRQAQDRPARRSTGAWAGGNIAMWVLSRRANGNYHDISKTWLAHGYLPQQGRAASLMSRSVHSGWQWKPVRSSRVMS
jgi:hypothetical protein